MKAEALRGCSGQAERESPVMGSVLSFAPRNAATSRKPIDPGATASVVIFPGIRYERPEAGGPEHDIASLNRPDTRHDKPLPRH